MSQQIIQRFYEAFSRRDAETMAACYHPDAVFRDGAFDLRGGDIGDMWRMLCRNGKDLTLTFAEVTDRSAHWEAHYTFSKTGRKVHNIIDAQFQFKDGLIIEHIDTFDFWRWSKQALGTVGLLMGWSGWLQNKVRQSAMASLRAFQGSR